MRLSAFEIASSDIAVDGTVLATVRLDEAAPYTGVRVLLGSSDAAIKVPKHVDVPPGQPSVSFTIGAGSLRNLEPYQVWAQVRETVFRQKLVLRPPGIAELNFNGSVVEGGLTTTLTVLLDSPAPSTGALILLVEIAGYAGEQVPLITDLPPSLYIASGGTQGQVVLTTRAWDGGRMPPPRSVDTAVDAFYGDSSKRAILTVTDP